MSLLGGLVGNLIGNVAGKLFGSATDAHYQSQMMEKQEALQEKLFQFENKNKHQFEVYDLKAAGLNPILSATNGSAVGVGGVSISNFSSDSELYASAKQLELAKNAQKIEQQNADSNSKNADTNRAVGASQSALNLANENLAIQNANTAQVMRKWQEEEAKNRISNNTKVAAAQSAYYLAAGAAAQLQASAAAADHYQNVQESIERMKGYSGQREGQMIGNKAKLDELQFTNWRRELLEGKRHPQSAFDLWRGFMDFAN